MIVDENKLLEFLIGTGLVSRKQIEEINKQASDNSDGSIESIYTQNKQSVSDLLCLNGALSRDDMRRAQAHVLGVPFVDLRGEKIDPDVLVLIPEPVSRSHNVVAYKHSNDILEIAMLDIRDLSALDFLHEKLPKTKIATRLSSEEFLRAALVQYQQFLRNGFGETIAREAGVLNLSVSDVASLSPDELKKQSKNKSAMRAVDALLRHSLAQSATDIHIEPREKDLVVRYRIGGRLHDAMTLPKTASQNLVLRLKSLANLSLQDCITPQDSVFRVHDGSQWVSVQLTTLPVFFGEKITARLRKESPAGFSFEGLGFRSSAVENLYNALHGKNGGMVVSAGVDGSRTHATTSLYTMLEMLNVPSRSVGTVERRVLRNIPYASQVIVDDETGGFTEGLRTLLRRDMDVIMVGDTSGEETVKLTVNAALGGRTMLVAHEAPSATDAIANFRALEVEPVSLASALRAVVGHCAVRRLDSSKRSYIPTQRELEVLYEIADMNRVLAALKEESVVGSRATWRDIHFYRSPFLSENNEDGYSGVLALQEVVPIDAAMKELIAYGATAEELSLRARADGHLSLIEDGIFKAAQGKTSIEEVLGAIS